MLDLDTIVDSSSNLLPTTGFWGFLLEHWLVIAVCIMALGFALDQVLYVVRYRPQDKWRSRYYAFRRFLTERFGVRPAEEPSPREEPNPLEDTGVTVHMQAERIYTPARDTGPREPRIRRGAAQQAPRSAPELYAPPKPIAPDDTDAPLVVRAPKRPVNRTSDEPVTRRGENRTE